MAAPARDGRARRARRGAHAPIAYPTGKGFVLSPDDGSDPVVLPYRAGRFGFSLEHGLLVETLRAHAERHEGIEYVAPARATRLERDALTFEHRGGVRTVRAERVVGAIGAGPRPVARGEVLTFASAETRPSHRLAWVTLHGAELPFEGYLHVFVGGPGPAAAYRIGPARVRLLLDVPLSARVPREGGLALYESYAPALPAALADALRGALAAGPPAWSYGALRPRTELVTGAIAWVGDAAGSYHPLTAIDLTLGLGDARAWRAPAPPPRTGASAGGARACRSRSPWASTSSSRTPRPRRSRCAARRIACGGRTRARGCGRWGSWRARARACCASAARACA
ncbi:MAG: hypothetical protein M5U28_04700 [Sandaracinaceae bacterium]|nr:hypothetical protein [Sandaracinaceae bacterium]